MASGLQGLDLSTFWAEGDFASDEYTDELLTDDLLSRVESRLGYRLPQAYVDLCRHRNGGAPRLTCHPTATPTSWAADHVAVTNIKAIGFDNIWSLCGALGHSQLLEEWGYPPIGIYFGDCPSGGHDALCLDYRVLNGDGEPSVVHVGQKDDYKITPVAASFLAFLAGLKDETDFHFD